ncbi:UNVERIFIED_CONTAM: hypothetical protein PYX00_010014 [Menopon gallinae]|uniref:Uncharacterized protein n=1 Tax=Menopon gallinae TaxID=328185 RepID=A0AAW2HDN9_9NEOP
MSSKAVLLLLLFGGGVLSREAQLGSPELGLIESTVGSWIRCGFGEEPSRCLEEKTVRQVRQMSLELGRNWRTDLEEVRSGKSLDEDGDDGTKEYRALASQNAKMLKTIEEENKSENPGLIDEVSDFFANGLLKFFDDVFDLKEDDAGTKKNGKNAVEARGHKKKYLKKQNKHLKIILLLMLIKNKVKMFLHKFTFLIQLKFLAIAAANLLINLIRLWLELKKKHKPNKVIYYEKSHHQHHYDNEHIHDDDDHYSYPTSYKHYGHHEEEEGGGGGGIWPWSRSYVQHKSDMWGNPPYRVPGSHNLVYMNQRPMR